MDGIITKIFRPDWTEVVINKNIHIDIKWNVIDSNNNWYTKVPYVWDVTKVELVRALKAWTENADDIPATGFMSHRDKWANALLWTLNGAIAEVKIDFSGN